MDLPGRGGDERTGAEEGGEEPLVRSVLAVLGLVVVVWMAKAVIVVVTFVGSGLLGYAVAETVGVMVAVTAGAVLVLAACYAVVTRTPETATARHEICGQSMIWISCSWVIVMGWLLGERISGTAAVIGLLTAVFVVALVGLVVASQLEGDLVTTLRRRTAQK
ncbi:hypothetical protein [Phytoactinopolyspora endophytica]|uniref:hypothetical protein n=1 Tax=Phytoactinopolyspora endophytica TaxID=1642495 RepID=UPI00101B68E3|nr:hypothetical protein [Phytoactinopolyspora endophytica]